MDCENNQGRAKRIDDVIIAGDDHQHALGIFLDIDWNFICICGW